MQCVHSTPAYCQKQCTDMKPSYVMLFNTLTYNIAEVLSGVCYSNVIYYCCEDCSSIKLLFLEETNDYREYCLCYGSVC